MVFFWTIHTQEKPWTLTNLENFLTDNRAQLKNPDISGAHWEFSLSMLKLNVKMAPEMSGCFNWLRLFFLLLVNSII